MARPYAELIPLLLPTPSHPAMPQLPQPTLTRPSTNRGLSRIQLATHPRATSFSQLSRGSTTESRRASLSKMPLVDQRRLDHRLERFDSGARSQRQASRSAGSENEMAFQSKPTVDENGAVDWDAITIKGTCRKLEKDYLRLTQVSWESTWLTGCLSVCLGK